MFLVEPVIISPQKPHLQKEIALLEQGYRFIAGLDEAGRGAWAGPVAAAPAVGAAAITDHFDARGARDTVVAVGLAVLAADRVVLLRACDIVGLREQHGLGREQRLPIIGDCGYAGEQADQCCYEGTSQHRSDFCPLFLRARSTGRVQRAAPQ